MSSISDFLTNSSRRFPKKTAIITKAGSITYEELDLLSLSALSTLSKYPKKSVVSIIFENTIDAVATYLGILRSNLIAHLISPNSSQNNFLEQVNSARSRLVVGNNALIAKLSTGVEKTDFATILSANKPNDKQEVHNDLIAYLIYTSGTTSKPKGVAVSNANVVFTTKNIVNVLGYTDSDVDVLPLPLSHSFGLGCLHTSLYVGSTIVLHKNTVNPLEIFESVKTHGATTFAAVPATLTKLLVEFPDNLEQSFSNLRLVITNSTSIPTETVKNYRRILKKGKLATYYGLTEASRSTFMIFDIDNKETSVGLPPSGVQIKLVDENGQNASHGEIWIKGGNVIKNYWNDTDCDNNLLDDWLKTGDLGYLDDDGYLYLTGRTDDVINVAGEKVSPQEVERIVKLLADIEEAVAVGTKHDVFGHVVKLFVKKTQNSTLTKSEVMSHCIKHLERYKVPTLIEFVDDFPRTEYGKIKRFMLQ